MVTSVQQAFREFQSRLELSEAHQTIISTHHNAVRDWIEAYDPAIDTKLVGSLQRKTRIRPRPEKDPFDIDVLVVLGTFVQWLPGGVTPKTALDRVEDIVSASETYDRMGPETDNPTIVLPYADGTRVELIPAYHDEIGLFPDGTPVLPVGRGFWIPKSGGWAMADYDFDAGYVSARNEACGKHLVPMIKILKAAKRNVFSTMRSYHLEVMALTILPTVFRQCEVFYSGVQYPQAVWLFFILAKEAVLEQARIPGSKSPPACLYLSTDDRQALSRAFRTLATVCGEFLTLGDREAIAGWRELFGDPFPAYGD